MTAKIAVVMTAAEHLRALSAAMADRYVDDCVAHAAAIAALLLAEGRSPWIGRVRDTRVMGELTFHGPLIPRRFVGRNAPAWTTHYIACSGAEVYDPLVGEPTAIDGYTELVFGRALDVETHLDVDVTAELLRDGTLRQHCRSVRGPR